jgi:ABC-type phosphate transport system ATPase subunit
MQQASRISDKTAFFLLGKLIEFGDTDQLFPESAGTDEQMTISQADLDECIFYTDFTRI